MSDDDVYTAPKKPVAKEPASFDLAELNAVDFDIQPRLIRRALLAGRELADPDLVRIFLMAHIAESLTDCCREVHQVYLAIPDGGGT